jgi:hypothetical protein
MGPPLRALPLTEHGPDWLTVVSHFSRREGLEVGSGCGASLKPRKAPWKRRERGGRYFSRPDKSKPTPGRLGVPVGVTANGRVANPLD